MTAGPFWQIECGYQRSAGFLYFFTPKVLFRFVKRRINASYKRAETQNQIFPRNLKAKMPVREIFAQLFKNKRILVKRNLTKSISLNEMGSL